MRNGKGRACIEIGPNRWPNGHDQAALTRPKPRLRDLDLAVGPNLLRMLIPLLNVPLYMDGISSRLLGLQLSR